MGFKSRYFLFNSFVIIIFLLVIILYLVRLSNRPLIDPLIFVGFLLFIYFIRKFLIMFIRYFLIRYYIFVGKSPVDSRFSRILESIRRYFIIEFVDNYLAGFFFVNMLFYKIFEIFNKVYTILSYRVFFFVFVYIPWIIFLVVFIYEILIQGNLVVSLYFLFFSFASRKALNFCFWIVHYKISCLQNISFHRYFPYVKEDDKTLFAYDTNNLRKAVYSQKTNKDVISNWNGAYTVGFLQNRQNVTTIYCSFFEQIELFILNFNLLFFSCVFLLLILNTYNFFAVYCLFLPIFIIFLGDFVLVNFPVMEMKHKEHLLNALIQFYIWFEGFRQAIIAYYKLQDNDLVYKNPSCKELVESEYFFKEFEDSEYVSPDKPQK